MSFSLIPDLLLTDYKDLTPQMLTGTGDLPAAVRSGLYLWHPSMCPVRMTGSEHGWRKCSGRASG